MYDVVLFLLKLAMFVCAALVAVTSLELPVNNNTTNAMIASVQIILCSAVFFVYRMCAELLAAVREHRSYDAVFSVEASPDAVFSVGSDASSDTEDADAAGVAEKTQEEADTERERLRDASARAALGALNVGAEQSDEDTPVAFESIGVLREHIMLVHATGFLVWHSVLALDYSQPALAYSFTCGIVAAWLFQAAAAFVPGRCLARRLPCRESLHAVICLMCAAMLAAVSTLDAEISRETASSVVCGFVWPFFFARNSTAVCRRPAMILHSVRASHMTCLLLCASPLLAWTPHFDLPRRTLLLMYMVQPAVKVMCILLLCLSIQTGHTTDIVIALSVASCSQFLMLYPLDHAYQIVCVLIVSALLSMHVFALCWRDARRRGAPRASEQRAGLVP